MKKSLFIAVLIAMGLFVVETARSQDWNSLHEASKNIRSVRAEFLQKRYLRILTRPLLSQGRFFFYAPDSLRWEYLNPLRSVTLQKGESIQIYNFSGGAWKPEMTQAVEARRMVLAEIRQWFQGRFDESRGFEHRYVPGPPARVVMVPGEGIKRFVHRIEIVLSERPGVIDRVEIEEPEGSQTSIEFSNVEINSNFSLRVFEKP